MNYHIFLNTKKLRKKI